MHNLWVIIPTYNEREALPLFIPQIMPILRELNNVQELHVLVVDDNSPDGTGAIGDALGETYPEVSVLHRTEKNGLGDAYTAGFHHAYSLGATRIIQMDVDGSHQPQHLPAMWIASQASPSVLGSRYCRGGGIDGWSRVRLIISKIVSWYGRIMLGVKTRDPNSGFRCWDAALLMHILPHVHGHGFVFQAELTNCSKRAGYQPMEVPITFVERAVGTSKADWHIAVEEIWRLALIRVKPPRISRWRP